MEEPRVQHLLQEIDKRLPSVMLHDVNETRILKSSLENLIRALETSWARRKEYGEKYASGLIADLKKLSPLIKSALLMELLDIHYPYRSANCYEFSTVSVARDIADVLAEENSVTVLSAPLMLTPGTYRWKGSNPNIRPAIFLSNCLLSLELIGYKRGNAFKLLAQHHHFFKAHPRLMDANINLDEEVLLIGRMLYFGGLRIPLYVSLSFLNQQMKFLLEKLLALTTAISTADHEDTDVIMGIINHAKNLLYTASIKNSDFKIISSLNVEQIDEQMNSELLPISGVKDFLCELFAPEFMKTNVQKSKFGINLLLKMSSEQKLILAIVFALSLLLVMEPKVKLRWRVAFERLGANSEINLYGPLAYVASLGNIHLLRFFESYLKEVVYRADDNYSFVLPDYLLNLTVNEHISLTDVEIAHVSADSTLHEATYFYFFKSPIVTALAFGELDICRYCLKQAGIEVKALKGILHRIKKAVPDKDQIDKNYSQLLKLE